jgi:hypothetical protein
MKAGPTRIRLAFRTALATVHAPVNRLSGLADRRCKYCLINFDPYRDSLRRPLFGGLFFLEITALLCSRSAAGAGRASVIAVS